MKTNAQPTPTPWNIVNVEDDLDAVFINAPECCIDNLGWPIAVPQGPMAKANAEYIVRAANSHAQLVEALTRAEMRFDLLSDYGLQDESPFICYEAMKSIAYDAREEIRSALSAAKEVAK